MGATDGHPREEGCAPEGRWARGQLSLQCGFLQLFDFFFLRYNSHIIKPTILKSTIQWFLKYSRGCATIPTIKFQSIFITPKRNSYPLAVPPYPPSLQRSDFSLLFAASFPWYRLRPVSGPLEPQGWNVVEGRDLGIRDRHLLAVRFWGSA